jgi:hypothetical protein
MGNLALIDSGAYSAEKAVKTIQSLREYLNTPGMTYNLLAGTVYNKVAPYYILLGDYLNLFTSYDMVISQCDLDLLNAHLNQQEQIAKLRIVAYYGERFML